MAEEKQDLPLAAKELNEFFKEMSTEDEEGKSWSKYAEQWTQELIDCLSSTFKFPQVSFGSTSEGLRCYTPHDIGDFDLMLFPSREEMRLNPDHLHDIPECPGFVHIRGDGHPVLKDCLYQDTGYVPTSALKNFHPSVFGEISAILQAIPTMIRYLSIHMDPSEVAIKLENSCQSGPAVTMDFAQSYSNFDEQLGDTRGLEINERNRWFWEFVALEMCRFQGIEYGEKEQFLFEFVMKFAKAELEKIKENPTMESYLGMAQHMMSIEKMMGVRAQAEREWEQRKGEKARENEDQDESTRQLARGNEESQNLPLQHSNATVAELGGQEGESATKITAESSDLLTEEQNDLLNLNFEPDLLSRARDGFPNEKANMLNLEATVQEKQQQQRLHQQQQQRQQQQQKKRPPAAEARPSRCETENETDTTSEPKSESVAKLTENYSDSADKTKSVFDAGVWQLIWGIDENKYKEAEESYEKRALQHDRVSGIDIVPAFQCSGWPLIARDWLERERFWPSEDKIKQIVDEGFHIVVKTPKGPEVNPDIAFRLSFSNAEYLLSQEMSELQKECYRCFKLYHKAYLKTKEKVLVTFHLKTVLLWACEETGTDFWTDDNRAACVTMLLDKLQRALVTRTLPHFFMPSLNLFADAAVEYPEILNALERKLQNIKKNPTQFRMEHIARCAVEKPQVDQSVMEVRKQLADSPVQLKPAVSTNRSEMSPRTLSSSKRSYTIHPPYHEFVATTREIFQEVLDVTSGTRDLDSSDELLVSTMEELKKLLEIDSCGSEAGLTRMLEHSLRSIYDCSLFDQNPSLRNRILRGITGQIKIWQFVAQQPEVHTGDVDAITRRIWSSMGPDVPEGQRFDITNLIPLEGAAHLLQQISGLFDPLESTDQRPSNSLQKSDVADPLDQMPLD